MRALILYPNVAIQWAIARSFHAKSCLAEVNFRIRNLVLVNRLIATSRKITNISCEMLVNYRWYWFWLSSQNSGLTFACQHVKFTWCRLLQPANRECRVGFHQLTKFLPTSINKHNSMGYLLPCAIDFETNHPTIYLQCIGILCMSNESRHVISMGPRQTEVPGEAIFCSVSYCVKDSIGNLISRKVKSKITGAELVIQNIVAHQVHSPRCICIVTYTVPNMSILISWLSSTANCKCCFLCVT